jgi:hypothetical protein
MVKGMKWIKVKGSNWYASGGSFHFEGDITSDNDVRLWWKVPRRLRTPQNCR